MADPGEGPGGPGPPLSIDQDEARRAEKLFLDTPHPPYLRVWMTPPPPPPPPSSYESGFPISRGLSRQDKKKGKERDFCRPLSTERELLLILKRDKKMIGRTLDKRRRKFTSLGALMF